MKHLQFALLLYSKLLKYHIYAPKKILYAKKIDGERYFFISYYTLYLLFNHTRNHFIF